MRLLDSLHGRKRTPGPPGMQIADLAGKRTMTTKTTQHATTIVIRRLQLDARASLLAHYLGLSVTDRWLRFGHSLPATALASYVDRMDFGRDAILGVYDDQQLLVGVAHAAFDADPADVALSVVSAWRGRGIGAALFASAVAHATRRGLARIAMQFLSSNAPILRIAERFGMTVRRNGRDAEAHLDLVRATWETNRAAP